jgi:hypothetical protein
MENTPNTTEKTKTLIRIAASFDESGNARAAVDFYGETEPQEQLRLLGKLLFEIYARTDVKSDCLFAEPNVFPGSQTSLNVALAADGTAEVFTNSPAKEALCELVRSAAAGWLEKNPEFDAKDIALATIAGHKPAENDGKNKDGLFSLIALTPLMIAATHAPSFGTRAPELYANMVVFAGKALPRRHRLFAAARLALSAFFKA